mmetsp:Transcript_4292/g.5921  ORF Transcript_4292/g.5921 Transcript_4292/m.5921 type:complete len:311 (-) Transcript_4292:330-1262(-)
MEPAEIALCTDLNVILNRLRTQMSQRGAKGIRGLALAFKNADFNGNKSLDRMDFEEVLGNCNLFLKAPEITTLFKYFDINSDGSLGYEEFLKGMAPPLNERRLRMVQRAFEMLDIDGSGVLTVSDICEKYVVDQHPDVQRGKARPEDVLEEFLEGFEGSRSGNSDGQVTWEEFSDYYHDLSASIPDDDYFCTIMEQSWLISESEEPEINSELDNLEEVLRKKIMEKTKGNEGEAGVLRKTFRFFDQDESNRITMDEFRRAMEVFGICLERKHTSGFFARYDPNGDGMINYEEFINALLPDQMVSLGTSIL